MTEVMSLFQEFAVVQHHIAEQLFLPLICK